MSHADRLLSRRALLRQTLLASVGVIGLAACGPAAPSAAPPTSAPAPGPAQAVASAVVQPSPSAAAPSSATSAAASPSPFASAPTVTGATQQTAGSSRPTLMLAVSRDLANGQQDPYFTHTSLMCHEPLIGLDNALAPVPKLATQWSLSEDGLTWTFQLRDGVTFTDGTSFDADAAIANLRRDIQISPRTSPYTAMIAPVAFGPVADLRKLDSHSFQIVHSSPYPLLEATMSNFFSAMFSPASFADNGDFTGIPASTGPWRLTDWQPAQTLTLERNDQYWAGAPPLQRITVRVIPDANTRVSALVAGEVDAVMELGALLPAEAQQLQSMADFVVGADPISITQYLHFNCSTPPFDDARVRQIVSLAFDRDSVVRNLVLGFATPGQSLLSPISTRWFSPKGTPRFDATAAQQQAAQALAGQRAQAAFPFSVSAGQARPYKQIAEYLQATLRPLGIDLDLRQMEDAALTDATNRGDWNLRFSQLGWANGDPDFIMGNFLYSKGAANTTSHGGYHNGEVDQLVESGRQERDVTKRFGMYERLQEIAAQDVPTMAVYHERAPYAYRKDLTALSQRSNFQPTLDTVRWR